MLGDPAVIAAMRDMYAAKMKGAHMLTLGSPGPAPHVLQEAEIKKVADLKGVKVRVQATVTEDTQFPAYGAQVVHMPFGEVYTSLQTGVVDMAENGNNIYIVNKHYEVAPVLSLTEHEANNAVLFVSDKVWSSLTAEQKKWVQAAADEVSKERAGPRLSSSSTKRGEAREDRRQDRQGCRQVRLRGRSASRSRTSSRRTSGRTRSRSSGWCATSNRWRRAGPRVSGPARLPSRSGFETSN